MNYSHTIRVVLCVFLITLLNTSCSFLGNEKKWKPIKPQQHAFVHTVNWSDETMELISKWYTGSINNADRLAKANPTVNPNKLTPETVIYIPDKLLTTRQTMTRSFIDASKKKKVVKSKRKSAEPSQVKSKDAGDDEFELFGPR